MQGCSPTSFACEDRKGISIDSHTAIACPCYQISSSVRLAQCLPDIIRSECVTSIKPFTVQQGFRISVHNGHSLRLAGAALHLLRSQALAFFDCPSTWTSSTMSHRTLV
ncbi:hypothetical protein Q9966_008579 [Columba livia]|nr:hypothetical protein Q9966_008579 [Columba livia]